MPVQRYQSPQELDWGRSGILRFVNFGLQDKVKQGKVNVHKVAANDNVADAMTKHVSREVLGKHLVSTGQTTSSSRHCLAPGNMNC